MNLQGKIIEIFSEQQISENFFKREFVVEYAPTERFIESVKFEAINDTCHILDMYNVGDVVIVDFNLKGRKWKNQKGEIKYFNSVQAWKLKKINESENGEISPSLKSSSPEKEDFPF